MYHCCDTGCYFGLAMSYIISSPAAHNHENMSSSYSSDRFTLVGTLVIIVNYAAFNSATLAGNCPADLRNYNFFMPTVI